MPDDLDHLVRRLIDGDAGAAAEIRRRSATDTSPTLLVAAALITPDPGDLLARAAGHAATTRDRQLVAIARTHLDGDAERVDAYVRDHLADHPDNALATWIASLAHATRSQP